MIGWHAGKFIGILRPQIAQMFSLPFYHKNGPYVQIYGLVGEEWWNFNLSQVGA